MLRIAVLFSTALFASCASEFYSTGDFSNVRKIDTHVHLNAADPALVDLAAADNFSLVTVNVDAGTPIDRQEAFALEQISQAPDRVTYLTTFGLDGWGSDSWTSAAISRVQQSFSKGALGVKIWKNIGMVHRDSSGAFVMIDDPAFDPLIRYIVSQDKTVLGHLGEPKNCWLPLDKMTVNNDRSYFRDHPQYHMFLHPDFPSYEDQINARDNFLARHPDMRFVGAHLGSLEWDVDELAKRLDRFPNMAVDMAARVCHLQYQSMHDREKVRKFIIRYQDRLIYATDGGISESRDAVQAKTWLHNQWSSDWKYFVTDEKMSVPEVNGEFQGLQLPRSVVDKIFYGNAVRWFRIPASAK